MDVLARVWSPRHVRFDLGKASTAPIRVVSAIGQLYELSDSARAASRHVDFARRWHSCKSIVEPKMSLNLADLAQSLSDSRSEERRVGKGCVSTYRSRWSRYQ